MQTKHYMFVGWATVVLLAAVIVALLSAISESWPKEPPAGWVIEKREFPEVEYRWKRPSGVAGMFPSSSYEHAVERAWSMFEFSRFYNSKDWQKVEAKQ